MVNVVLIGFGVIVFAIGLLLYISQLRQGLRADASKRWPTTSATIVSSALELSPDSRRRYRAAVQYRYRVGGKDYESNRVFWGGGEGRQKHMASVVATYPAGNRVKVYCDPQNPAEAVLDPTQNAGSKPLVLYAMGLMTLGLFSFTGAVYSLLH
jgi:hypothetical protein